MSSNHDMGFLSTWVLCADHFSIIISLISASLHHLINLASVEELHIQGLYPCPTSTVINRNYNYKRG